MDERMTLQQQVDALDDDEVIFIGSGAGFFFIGTKAEYEADIGGISREFTKRAKHRLTHLITMRAELPLKLKLLRKIKETTTDPEELKHIYHLSRAISSSAEKLKSGISDIPELEDYIAGYTPLRDRKVKDVYNRFQRDGVVIIVDGTERGPYWFRAEYKAGVSMEDEDDD